VLDKTLDCLRKEQVKEGNDISFQELSFQELREKFPQANFAPNQRGFLEHSAGILFADKCMATVQVINFESIFFNFQLIKMVLYLRRVSSRHWEVLLKMHFWLNQWDPETKLRSKVNAKDVK